MALSRGRRGAAFRRRRATEVDQYPRFPRRSRRPPMKGRSKPDGPAPEAALERPLLWRRQPRCEADIRGLFSSELMSTDRPRSRIACVGAAPISDRHRQAINLQSKDPPRSRRRLFLLLTVSALPDGNQSPWQGQAPAASALKMASARWWSVVTAQEADVDVRPHAVRQRLEEVGNELGVELTDRIPREDALENCTWAGPQHPPPPGLATLPWVRPRCPFARFQRDRRELCQTLAPRHMATSSTV